MNPILYAGALLRWASAHRDQLQQLIACLHQDWTQCEELLADFPQFDGAASLRTITLGEVLKYLPQIEALAASAIAAIETPGPLTFSAVVRAAMALFEATSGEQAAGELFDEMLAALPRP